MAHRSPRLMPAVGAMLAISALSLVFTFAAALAVLHAGGATTFAVESDSMVPAFARGDLVVVRPAHTLAVGDVVTFRVYGRLVTHRIVEADRETGRFRTRGDANPGTDPWSIAASDVVGTVRAVVHRAGFPLLLLAMPAGRVLAGNALIALLALMWWAVPRATRAAPGVDDQAKAVPKR